MSTSKEVENSGVLVSDEKIRSLQVGYETDLEEHTSFPVGERLNMTAAYGAGGRAVRDIYEKDRTERLKEIRSLREALKKAFPHIGHTKECLVTYWGEGEAECTCGLDELLARINP